MPRDKNAKARSTYTLEPYTTALNHIREHGYLDGLVPDADPEQAAFEAAFLSAIAAQVGRHAPHGAPYGIAYVSPTAEELTVRFTPQGAAGAARAVLPRRDRDGQLRGLPALRFHGLRRGTAARATWRGGSLWLAPAPAWEEEANALAGEATALWDEVFGDEGEYEAAAQIARGQADIAAALSTALRRIGLFADVPTLDFAARAPGPEELEGPSAWRLSARPSPGRRTTPSGTCPVVALTAPCGGLGITTLTAQLAATLAHSGSLVAAVGFETPVSSDLPAFFGLRGTRPETDQPWTEVREYRSGGLLAFARLDQDGSARRRIAELRTQFDLILIDASAHRGATTAAEVCDLLYTLVTLDRGVFFTRQLADPAHEGLVRREEVAGWLARRWGQRRSELQDRIWAVLDENEEEEDEVEGGEFAQIADDDAQDADSDEYYQAMLRLTIEADAAEYARLRAQFLAEVQAEGAQLWGEDWTAATLSTFERRDDRRAERWRRDHDGPQAGAQADEEEPEDLDEDESAYRALQWVTVPVPAETVAGYIEHQAASRAGSGRRPDGLIANRVGHFSDADDMLAAARSLLDARAMPLLEPVVPERNALKQFGVLLASDAPGADKAAVAALKALALEILESGRRAVGG